MNNPKWGVKRQCQECGAHFYDLKRSKVVCPKCDAPFAVEAKPKVKRAIATPPKAAPPAPLKKPAEKSDETEMSAEDKVVKEFAGDILTDNNPAASDDDDDDDDEDENSFEDASELGKDEDDMAEVIDGSRKVDES